jgi:hypothetical protein
VGERGDGGGIRLASLPVRQLNAAVRENGTYEATRQSRWLRTADGFAVLAAVVGPVHFDVDQRSQLGSCGLGLRAALSQKGAVVFPQSGTDLGHPVWWPYLSSSGLIRCNSIRDTV